MAENYSGAGKISVNNTEWFNNYDWLTFGAGMLEYSGVSGAITKPITIDVGGNGNGNFTFSIPEQVSLEINAPLAISSGKMIVTGQGTLKLQNADMPHNPPSSGGDGEPLTWNNDGTLASGFTGGLNICGANLVLCGNGPFLFPMAEIDIGTANSSDSALEIIGNGRENCSFYNIVGVSLGKYGFLTAPSSPLPIHRLLFRNTTAVIGTLANQYSNAKPVAERGSDCRVEIDNAVVTNLNNQTRLAIHRGNYSFTIKNGGVYTAKEANYRFGLQVASGQQAVTGEVAVIENSLLETYSYNPHSTDQSKNALRVESGSTLAVARANTSIDRGVGTTIRFDDATLKSLRMGSSNNEPDHSLVADWFSGFTNPIIIGNGGIKLQSDNYAEFNAKLLREEGSLHAPTANIEGSGTVAFRTLPDDINLSVQAGSEIRILAPQTASSKEVLFAEGSNIRGSAKDAFLGLRINGGGLQITAEARNEMIDAEWSYTNALATTLGVGKWTSGPIALTPGSNKDGYNAGALWRREMVDVSKDFSVLLKYYNGRLRTEIAGGIAIVFHNDPRQLAALGQIGNGVGYAATDAVAGNDSGIIHNSFAIGLHTHRGQLTVGRNGIFGDEVKSLNRIKRFLVTERKPIWIQLNYNASAKAMRVRVSDQYGSGVMRENLLEWTVPCDLVQACGSNLAYFGVTAADDLASPVTHCVENVSFCQGDNTQKSLLSLGGEVNPLGSVKLNAMGLGKQKAFLLDSMIYTDGIEVQTEGSNQDLDNTSPSYLSFRQWIGSGTVRKTGSGNLGLITYDGEPGTDNVNFSIENGGLTLRQEKRKGISIAHNDGKWQATNNQAANPAGIPDYPYFTSTDGNGIIVGHTTGSSGGTVIHKDRIPVTSNFKLRFRGLLSGSGAHGWSIFFHNDPRGISAYNELGNGNGQYGYGKSGSASKPITKSFALGFANTSWELGVYKIGYNGLFEKFKMAETGNQTTVDLRTYDGASNHVRDFDFELSYDHTNQRLGLKVSAIEDGTPKQFERIIENVNLQAICEDDLAYLGFGFDSGGRTTLLKVLDFQLEYDKSGDKRIFAKSVALGSGETRVNLDAQADDGDYQLAQTVTASEGAVVRVSSENNNPARLDLGHVITSGNMTIIAQPEDQTQVLLPETLNMPNRATLTADGIKLAVERSTQFPKEVKLSLINGAKIHVAPDAQLTAARIYINGARPPVGTYTATNCDWVTGEGKVIARGTGLLLIIR